MKINGNSWKAAEQFSSFTADQSGKRSFLHLTKTGEAHIVDPNKTVRAGLLRRAVRAHNFKKALSEGIREGDIPKSLHNREVRGAISQRQAKNIKKCLFKDVGLPIQSLLKEIKKRYPDLHNKSIDKLVAQPQQILEHLSTLRELNRQLGTLKHMFPFSEELNDMTIALKTSFATILENAHLRSSIEMALDDVPTVPLQEVLEKIQLWNGLQSLQQSNLFHADELEKITDFGLLFTPIDAVKGLILSLRDAPNTSSDRIKVLNDFATRL
ncbi:MAG: hypothetical protein A2Y14_04665 [Verrucomicrobia bacterium GWF2_51_19]|nr:MAG: hypothetical protein A2Y14_04665 [Verrucomicrobia bacterium GWF2_51_19]HCJ12301.1 hypothetical protein [Opitutae bacterium]